MSMEMRAGELDERLRQAAEIRVKLRRASRELAELGKQLLASRDDRSR